MRAWWIGLGLLFGAAGAACGGGGGASGSAVDPAEYKDAEVLNPRLDDGRIVHLGYDRHHPECFVFAGGGAERKAEEIECPEPALRLKECPGGVVHRSRTQPGCVCVDTAGEEPRRIECPP
jgi:hypothetical protein